jgi:hypothetical protein
VTTATAAVAAPQAGANGKAGHKSPKPGGKPPRGNVTPANGTPGGNGKSGGKGGKPPKSAKGGTGKGQGSGGKGKPPKGGKGKGGKPASAPAPAAEPEAPKGAPPSEEALKEAIAKAKAAGNAGATPPVTAAGLRRWHALEAPIAPDVLSPERCAYWGVKPGSRHAAYCAQLDKLGTDPAQGKTMKQLIAAAGLVNTFYSFSKQLIGKGLLEKTPDGRYVLPSGTGKPAKAKGK